MDRIKTICVLPAADSKLPHRDIKDELENFAIFIQNKINEYEKAISNTSAVVFTANVLQNRVASWEFAVQLTKLYEVFGVRRSDEFAKKLDHLRDSDETTDEIKSLIAKVSSLFEQWDLFLKKIDGELEKTVGPQSLQDLTKHDAFHLSLRHRRHSSIAHSTLQSFIKESAYDMTLISVIISFSAPESADHTVHIYENLAEFQKYGCDVLMLIKEDVGTAFHLSLRHRRHSSIAHSTLQSFIKESAYDMTLISVIISFSAPESADHTVHIYENLAEFQKYGCDVLMLIKEDVGTGGGFLKIVGVPFRQLMGEEEALNRLLQHRQSALSLAGSKMVHMFTEIICNDQTLAISDDANAMQKAIPVNQTTSGGSTILVDKMGRVLYSYTGRDNADWPDVAILLENASFTLL
uniref:TIR domain-containing protein n=1 Tax=Ascaris lumbricoides TaxID=6252 RepID=A0A0M3I8Z1_ASCLU